MLQNYKLNDGSQPDDKILIKDILNERRNALFTKKKEIISEMLFIDACINEKDVIQEYQKILDKSESPSKYISDKEDSIQPLKNTTSVNMTKQGIQDLNLIILIIDKELVTFRNKNHLETSTPIRCDISEHMSSFEFSWNYDSDTKKRSSNKNQKEENFSKKTFKNVSASKHYLKHCN